MNVLENYLDKINNSSYDCGDVSTINSEFNEVIEQLKNEGKSEIAKIADLDRQVFSVQKSFSKKNDKERGTIDGLGWQFSGIETLEDGSQINIYWPDVTKYTSDDFEYFEKRYKSCVNIFAKTEYGLMIYFGKKSTYSKHLNFKKELSLYLFELSKEYYNKVVNKDVKKFNYLYYFYNSLQMAFRIALKSNINEELDEIIKYIFNIHQSWDIKKEGTLRVILDLSGLLCEKFSVTNSKIDFQQLLNKNLESAQELSKTYIWGSIYIIDLNILIEKKRHNSANYLLEYKAKLYEELAKDAESKSNMTCVRFVEEALRIYKQIKKSSDISRLEKHYSKLRGQFRLFENKTQLPSEIYENINNRIMNAIKESNPREIIQYFIITPWYDSIENVKKESIMYSQDSVLISKLPAAIIDKFGNTVDVFNTDEEKEKYIFWNSYSFNYQVGTQAMCSFFIEAYKVGKISYESVMLYLDDTWLNEEIERNYNGHLVYIKPIETLKPGLKRLFSEFENFMRDESYNSEFVTVIDSLTLKIEGLLRFLCERLNIPTFRTTQKGADKIVMEKLLDDLLAEIAHEPPLRPEQKTNFNEEDRILIKYVLSEKVGLNLRNEVAHGLMDIFEYSFDRAVVIFCIIIKLSIYKFTEIEGGTDNANCK